MYIEMAEPKEGNEETQLCDPMAATHLKAGIKQLLARK